MLMLVAGRVSQRIHIPTMARACLPVDWRQNLPLGGGLMYSICIAIPGLGRDVGRAGRRGQVAERLEGAPLLRA